MSASQESPKTPVHFGILLYNGFTALDAFGPLDCLNGLTMSHPSLQLSIIAHTLSPIRTCTMPGSTFFQSIVPTHTFSAPPPQLDVLFIPGGYGMYEKTEEMEAAKKFIGEVYPKLMYLCTVCTGSALIAMVDGVLDGKKATSNKMLFKRIEGEFPKVEWVAQARWVVDGNIYTASGVTAGIDMTLAFITAVYGKEHADTIGKGLEYQGSKDANDDPFAKEWGLV